jgi:short-subunit dehydrogenase
MEWKGKTALITGGVSGIGFGIARAFSAAGIDLILTYRNEDYRVRAEAWFKLHARAIPRFVSLDVTDRGRWAEVAVEVGPVHILVNNGLVTFIPRIKALGQGGHIVNVASMAAYLPGPQAGIYTASKFAVRGLTESLRFNLASCGIGVSLMCPGLTKTNAWDSALRRPADFAASGFAPADRSVLEQFGAAFEAGMDPLEVGDKTLAGMMENRGIIFTHPEFVEDFAEIYRDSVAALPNEPAPEARLHIERLRREANRAAAAGKVIGLGDLT